MFLICIGCGVFLEFLWITSENWFFSDLIAITIAFTIIRLFRLTSFKWILIMYVAAYSYNIIWMRNFSNHFGENYKLTTVSPISLPVKIICPELSSSPFKACSYMSIADVVLPGLLLTYSKMFDVLHNSNDFYFNAGFIGLIVGFLIDVIVYYSKSLPTPCFLYTGPLLLIISLAIAFSRDELLDFINGFTSNVFENKSLRKSSDFLKENINRIATDYEEKNSEVYELKDFSKTAEGNENDEENTEKYEKRNKMKNPYDQY